MALRVIWLLCTFTTLWLMAGFATKKYDLYNKPWYIKYLPVTGITLFLIIATYFVVTTPL